MKPVHIQKQQRKFTKPSSISSCLKCSICMDPFFMPTRLYCGHTFCYECVNSCIKTKPNCPVCRTTVVVNNAGRDLLAYNIINELEVFCIYEDCSWRGELGLLQLHLMHECLLHSSSQTKRHNQQKNEIFLKPTVDEQVEQKINENIKKGCLISRAIMSDDSLKAGVRFDVAVKMLKTDSNMSESITNPKNSKDKNSSNKQNENLNNMNKDQGDNIDFLMQLYD